MWVLLLGALLACQAADDKAQADLDKMQGRWKAAKMEDDAGREMPPEMLKRMIFVIKASTLEARFDGLKQPPAKFKLDPAKKPKALDMTGFGQKRDADGRYLQNSATVACIYAIEGDTLKICLARDEKAPRPKEFKHIKNKATLLILERAKDGQ